MAAGPSGPSHNPIHAYPRSPARSYDSSSVSSHPSPKPLPHTPGHHYHYNHHNNHHNHNPHHHHRQPGPYLGPGPRPPHPSVGGVHPFAPANQQPPTGFQPFTPMSSTTGREPLPTGPEQLIAPAHHPPGSGGGGGQFGHEHHHLESPGAAAALPGSQQGKRQYRQRRKDPSCDACRERKVKCDATESTSCSECSSRNVKCQFTKETNRRMTSMKCIQELVKEKKDLEKHNSELRDQVETLSAGDVHFLRLPDLNAPPKRKKRPAPLSGLDGAREFARKYARGVWKADVPHRISAGPGFSSSRPSLRPRLPPRAQTDQLLHVYYTSVHTVFPILHWPSFHRFVEDAYLTNAQQAGAAQLTVFFAVLAAAGLFSSQPGPVRFCQPAEMLELARGLTDPWNNEFGLDDVRALALTALCLGEMNLKSAAWAALGRAVRAAQDIGLHVEIVASQGAGPGPGQQQQLLAPQDHHHPARWMGVEAEMRRRLWWTLYALDRGMAAELGRPAMIDDADCDVALPVPVDDHFFDDRTASTTEDAIQSSHSLLLPVLNTTRAYGPLLRSLSSPTLSPTRLASFDQHLSRCAGLFPPQCDPASAAPLVPQLLSPLAFVLSARLLLHRHNLGPGSSPEVRSAAVQQCTTVASETAQLLQRLSEPVADKASAMLTMHVFRCAIFSLWTGCFDAALAGVRVLASVGDRRDVAVPCGRFLAHFVALLSAKRAEHAARIAAQQSPGPTGALFAPPLLPFPHGHGSAWLQAELIRDEDLIALASADLQARVDAAWLWDVAASPPGGTAAAAGVGGAGLSSVEARTGMSVTEAREWVAGGPAWERLEGAVRILAAGGAGPAPTSATWSTRNSHPAAEGHQHQKQQQQPAPFLGQGQIMGQGQGQLAAYIKTEPGSGTPTPLPGMTAFGQPPPSSSGSLEGSIGGGPDRRLSAGQSSAGGGGADLREGNSPSPAGKDRLSIANII